MNRTTRYNNHKCLSLFSALLIGFITLTGIQGCSSSSSSTPPPPAAPLPDQDASGLFKSGTAELNSGAIMLNDLRAFVYQGRIIMFSVNGHILYDGQVNTITSDDYTATVDVYELGVKTQTGISVTGKVISQSQITGTIAGTGTYSGTFTLTFDPLYTRGASFARVDTSSSVSISYRGDLMDTRIGATTNNFDFDVPDFYSFTSRIPGPVRCITGASYIIPDININVYVLDEVLVKTDVGCTMSDVPNYTGFAAAVDGVTTDDTLIYATSNGINAQFAVLTR